MKGRRWRAALALTLALAAVATSCGSKSGSNPAGSATRSALPPSTIPTSAAPATTGGGQGSTCKFTADTVSAAVPQVLVQAPGAATAAPVTARKSLGCGAVVQVDKSGAANLSFGGTADCQILQDAPGQKVATAISRDPANAILRLVEGTALCTFPSGGSRVSLCGPGEIQITGTVDQVAATCNADPNFQVSVLRGEAKVKDPSGAVHEIGDGDQLGCDPNNCHAGIGAAGFTDKQLAVFRSQAEAMRIPSTTTSTTSKGSTATTSTTAAKTTTTTG